MAAFLGKGWAFPIRVNGRGGLDYTEGAALIEQSILAYPFNPTRQPA